MNAKNKLIEHWKQEESIAFIHGWDFSHIDGRFSEYSDLPWDYRSIILQHLTPEMKLLDIDTGGGEFLLSLGHPHSNTGASEAYPPNVELCRQELLPLGIDFRPGSATGRLPFDDEQFDMIINRHGDLNPEDIYRMLKPGGIFITQQVGALNDRELVTLVMGETDIPFPRQHLETIREDFLRAGFTICDGQEYFGTIAFTDIGALVWFARIIQWEFPGFSVDSCLDRLLTAQSILEADGCVQGHTHRFMLVARK